MGVIIIIIIMHTTARAWLHDVEVFWRIKNTCPSLIWSYNVLQIISANLASRTLSFYVFDHDAIGKDDLIGTISVPLASRKLSAPCIEWEELKLPGENDLEVILL